MTQLTPMVVKLVGAVFPKMMNCARATVRKACQTQWTARTRTVTGTRLSLWYITCTDSIHSQLLMAPPGNECDTISSCFMRCTDGEYRPRTQVNPVPRCLLNQHTSTHLVDREHSHPNLQSCPLVAPSSRHNPSPLSKYPGESQESKRVQRNLRGELLRENTKRHAARVPD